MWLFIVQDVFCFRVSYCQGHLVPNLSISAISVAQVTGFQCLISTNGAMLTWLWLQLRPPPRKQWPPTTRNANFRRLLDLHRPSLQPEVNNKMAPASTTCLVKPKTSGCFLLSCNIVNQIDSKRSVWETSIMIQSKHLHSVMQSMLHMIIPSSY